MAGTHVYVVYLGPLSCLTRQAGHLADLSTQNPWVPRWIWLFGIFRSLSPPKHQIVDKTRKWEVTIFPPCSELTVVDVFVTSFNFLGPPRLPRHVVLPSSFSITLCPQKVRPVTSSFGSLLFGRVSRKMDRFPFSQPRPYRHRADRKRLHEHRVLN